MACLSPSPSGRRLSELLEEKQEPFLLDIHLLEKGCPSSRLLDGYDAATCLAAPDNIAVLKRLTNMKKKAAAAASSPRGGKKNPAGILKLLVSKILQSTAACSRRPPALQYCDSFKTFVTPALSRNSDPGSCSESESTSSSSDDDEEQLSPVSVLDQPFESSPVHAKLSPSKTADMDVFRELLDAAYAPTLLTQLLANAKSDDISGKDTAAAASDNDEDNYGCRTSPKNDGRYDDATYWEAELVRVSALVAAEVPNALLNAAAEREDVGAGVAHAVLQHLLRELVVDLGRY